MDRTSRVRFGGDLDACGRPVVGRWTHPLTGACDSCEGCRTGGGFNPPWEFEPATSEGTNGNGYWVACECACCHVAGARIEDMDRSGRHLRCPHCAASDHPSTERTSESFAADPRVRRQP